jgi:hypothetical protein
MSEFKDKLKNLSKSPVLPMGFHTSIEVPGGRPALLIVGFSLPDEAAAAALSSSDVDAGLVMSSDVAYSKIRAQYKGVKVPLGVLLKDIGESEAREIADSGYDFSVLSTHMPLAILHRKEAGRFLMVDDSLPERYVQAINDLEVDGVFLNCANGASFTVETLLCCQYFREVLDKPLMLILPSLCDREVFRSLCLIGVSGIVVPATASDEVLADFRRVMDESSREVKRSRTSTGIALPYYVGNVADEEEEDT